MGSGSGDAAAVRRFVSAERKLARAERHLIDLSAEVEAFVRRVTEEVGTPVRETQADDGRRVFLAKILPPPPGELSVILGDFLQNARAALDHAIHDLAGTDRGTTRTGFPIALDRGRFRDEAKRLLGPLPPEYCLAIARLRPRAASHPLYQLDELAQVDRHRSIALVATAVAARSVSWYRAVPRDDDPDIRLYHLGIEADRPVLSLPPDSETRFSPTVRVVVAMQLAGPAAPWIDVLDISDSIRQRVAETLARLGKVRPRGTA